jgi:glycine cleavage system H protein
MFIEFSNKLKITGGCRKVNIPKDLYYTKEHEWVKVEGGIATIGITEYASHQLGDIVFVELPAIGDTVEQMDNMGVVESVKTVSDMYAPVSGEVIEQNKNLLQEVDGQDNDDFHPEYINEDPYGKGWMVKLKMSDEGELGNLLKPEAYAEIAK